VHFARKKSDFQEVVHVMKEAKRASLPGLWAGDPESQRYGSSGESGSWSELGSLRSSS
jgi:hypothetical protein